MMAAAATKVLLPGLLALATQWEAGCLAFASHSARQPSIDRSWALRGYAQIGDYFASFGNSDGDDSSEDGGDSPSNDEHREGKYIGHGRIGGDGNEGGVFDVNTYFNSFGSAGGDEPSTSSMPAPPQDDEEETATTRETQRPMERVDMTYEEIVAYNNVRLCPKMLLTQRAIQSFMYLLEECRDPHSGKWLEDYLGLQNLGNYHGTGAINVTRYPTWDAVLYDIMRQPNDKMIVSAKRRGRGHGGWSKNNPYLQERWVEFPIDIRPATLVQRLLPVREQIATEFLHDLEIVGLVDGMIMNSYFKRIKDGDDSTAAAFDRIAVEALANITQAEVLESSPFRHGNFDLLYSLCTQAAAHRFLREISADGGVTFEWFRSFYTKMVPEYFDGDQRFGRADDFIDALLRTPPSLVEIYDGKAVGLTDPLRIAERIIELRSEIASEWKGMMKGVKEDHAKLGDVLFRVMAGRTIVESGHEVIDIQEETTMADLSDSAGAFE